MTKDFEKELKWFTKRLLQIRLRDVKGFSLPIPFKLSEITGCRVVEFGSEMTPKAHLEELIEEIRAYFIKNSEKPVSRDHIKIVYSDGDLSATIFGIDSDLLRSFITKRLKDQTSLLETHSNNVLFYNGITTGVTLNAAEQSVFAKLRYAKDKNTTLSYIDIFEICAQHKGGEQETFRNRNATEEKKQSVARSTISYLLRKMNKSTLLEPIENDEMIKNVSGEGYQLMT